LAKSYAENHFEWVAGQPETERFAPKANRKIPDLGITMGWESAGGRDSLIDLPGSTHFHRKSSQHSWLLQKRRKLFLRSREFLRTNIKRISLGPRGPGGILQE